MQDIIAKAKAIVARIEERMRSLRRSASEEASEFISEAETEEIFVEEAAKETFRKRWDSLKTSVSSMLGKLSSRERIVLIFIIGIVIGFGVKTAGNGYLTIGYRDYTAQSADTYDLIALQKNVAESGSGSAFSGGAAAGGGTCSQ